MSFFKKKLATLIGKNGSTIDTVLSSDTYIAGETLKGEVIITSGTITQELDDLTISLHTMAEIESNRGDYITKVTLQKLEIDLDATINPGEVKTYPFEFVLPLDTPITKDKSKIWVSTSLDTDSSKDAEDIDYITILPSVDLTNVLNTFDELGFTLYECENKKRVKGDTRIRQEFEYKINSGPYKGKLSELEFNLIYSSEFVRVDMHMEILPFNSKAALKIKRGKGEEFNIAIFRHKEILDKEIVVEKITRSIDRYIN